MEFRGKTALITGGAVRLGRSLSLALAARGARIVIHYRHSSDAAHQLAEALGAQGVEAFLVQADLSSEGACRGVIEEAASRAGSLDILVNNAAVFHRHRLAESDEKAVLGEFWPNLFAPLFLIRAFAEVADRGRILNLLDRRITGHDPACLPYQLTKKGLEELTCLAALELAPAFTVNAVAPGAILAPPGEDAASLADLAGPIPLELQPSEQDVCEAALYLLGADALTGQVLVVDGGTHLRG